MAFDPRKRPDGGSWLGQGCAGVALGSHPGREHPAPSAPHRQGGWQWCPWPWKSPRVWPGGCPRWWPR